MLVKDPLSDALYVFDTVKNMNQEPPTETRVEMHMLLTPTCCQSINDNDIDGLN